MKKLNINSYMLIIEAIDNKNIEKIKILRESINENDIIFELFNYKLLTSERLQFIMNDCTKYLNISSNFIKNLMNNKRLYLLDIIFSNLKFYDNNFILQLLFYYRIRTAISTFDLNRLISNEKFKISINTKYSTNNIGKYLINECHKYDINKYIKNI